jgi:hypothetical protein
VACKTLSNLVRTSSLSGLTGLEGGGGSINVQGEEQKKLDVIANDVLKRALKVCTFKIYGAYLLCTFHFCFYSNPDLTTSGTDD